jgi:hypothetical protein
VQPQVRDEDNVAGCGVVGVGEDESLRVGRAWCGGSYGLGASLVMYLGLGFKEGVAGDGGEGLEGWLAGGWQTTRGGGSSREGRQGVAVAHLP